MGLQFFMWRASIMNEMINRFSLVVVLVLDYFLLSLLYSESSTCVY